MKWLNNLLSYFAISGIICVLGILFVTCSTPFYVPKPNSPTLTLHAGGDIHTFILDRNAQAFGSTYIFAYCTVCKNFHDMTIGAEEEVYRLESWKQFNEEGNIEKNGGEKEE